MWQHGQDNLLHPIILVWFWDSFGSIGASAKCMQQRSRISTWYDGWIVFSHWSKISGFADRKMEVTPALDGNNRSAAFNGDDDRDTAGSGQSPVCSSTQRWPIGAPKSNLLRRATMDVNALSYRSSLSSRRWNLIMTRSARILETIMEKNIDELNSLAVFINRYNSASVVRNGSL